MFSTLNTINLGLLQSLIAYMLQVSKECTEWRWRGLKTKWFISQSNHNCPCLSKNTVDVVMTLVCPLKLYNAAAVKLIPM